MSTRMSAHMPTHVSTHTGDAGKIRSNTHLYAHALAPHALQHKLRPIHSEVLRRVEAADAELAARRELELAAAAEARSRSREALEAAMASGSEAALDDAIGAAEAVGVADDDGVLQRAREVRQQLGVLTRFVGDALSCGAIRGWDKQSVELYRLEEALGLLHGCPANLANLYLSYGTTY